MKKTKITNIVIKTKRSSSHQKVIRISSFFSILIIKILTELYWLLDIEEELIDLELEHQFEESEKKSDKKGSFFCGLCLSSVKMLNHETTRTHFEKLEMLDQMQKVILKEKELPHCSICLKFFSSQNQLNYHLRKERHKSHFIGWWCIWEEFKCFNC